MDNKSLPFGLPFLFKSTSVKYKMKLKLNLIMYELRNISFDNHKCPRSTKKSVEPSLLSKSLTLYGEIFPQLYTVIIFDNFFN